MTDTWNQDIEKIIQALHTILYLKTIIRPLPRHSGLSKKPSKC